MKTEWCVIRSAAAEAVVAFIPAPELDYCYGGTRLVSWRSTDGQVRTIAKRLLEEESAVKNALLNLSIPSAVDGDGIAYISEAFARSKVGAARCIIRPLDANGEEALRNGGAEGADILCELFRSIGEFLNERRGFVKLTPDFGRYAGRADMLYEYTEHVLGIARDKGGCGGKSAYSADSVNAVIDALFPELPASVAVIGAAGSMGSLVLKHLQARGCKRPTVCDLQFDTKSVAVPDGCPAVEAEAGALARGVLRSHRLIIATTWGGEAERTDWSGMEKGTTVLLAHNLSLPDGGRASELEKMLGAASVTIIPGQLLTFGGALVSRIEWFYRQSNPKKPFGDGVKQFAHKFVRHISNSLVQRILVDKDANEVAWADEMWRLVSVAEPSWNWS